jgi:CBS domain-containing protein
MLRVRDIMTTDIVSATPDMTLREATELLVAHGISGAPVVRNGRVAGIVSASDLLLFASVASPAGLREEVEEGSGGESPVEWDRDFEPAAAFYTRAGAAADTDVRASEGERSLVPRDALEEHTVAEVMTRAVISLPPSALVRHAADYMRRAGVHRLLVVDHGELVGIVSTMDIARVVSEGRLSTRTYLFGAPAATTGS